MVFTLSPITNVVKATQSLNASFPIATIPFGMVSNPFTSTSAHISLLDPVQTATSASKASWPMEVTRVEMATLVKTAFLNADSPMVSTLLPKVTLVKPVFMNASLPMVSTLLPVTSVVKAPHPIKASSRMFSTLSPMTSVVKYSHPPKVSLTKLMLAFMVTLANGMSKNTYGSIVLTPLPITTWDKALSPLPPPNAASPMVSTLSGITTLVKAEP
jgi:hypothetical protein